MPRTAAPAAAAPPQPRVPAGAVPGRKSSLHMGQTQQVSQHIQSVPTAQRCLWSETNRDSDVCNHTFSDAEGLYAHLVAAHVGRRLTNNLCLQCKVIRCPQRGQTFAKRDHVTSHLRSHVSLKSYVCTVCAKAFKWPHDLKKHVHKAGHHGQKTSCNQSGLLGSFPPVQVNQVQMMGTNSSSTNGSACKRLAIASAAEGQHSVSAPTDPQGMQFMSSSSASSIENGSSQVVQGQDYYFLAGQQERNGSSTSERAKHVGRRPSNLSIAPHLEPSHYDRQSVSLPASRRPSSFHTDTDIAEFYAHYGRQQSVSSATPTSLTSTPSTCSIQTGEYEHSSQMHQGQQHFQTPTQDKNNNNIQQQQQKQQQQQQQHQYDFDFMTGNSFHYTQGHISNHGGEYNQQQQSQEQPQNTTNNNNNNNGAGGFLAADCQTDLNMKTLVSMVNHETADQYRRHSVNLGEIDNILVENQTEHQKFQFELEWLINQQQQHLISQQQQQLQQQQGQVQAQSHPPSTQHQNAVCNSPRGFDYRGDQQQFPNRKMSHPLQQQLNERDPTEYTNELTWDNLSAFFHQLQDQYHDEIALYQQQQLQQQLYEEQTNFSQSHQQQLHNHHNQAQTQQLQHHYPTHNINDNPLIPSYPEYSPSSLMRVPSEETNYRAMDDLDNLQDTEKKRRRRLSSPLITCPPTGHVYNVDNNI